MLVLMHAAPGSLQRELTPPGVLAGEQHAFGTNCLDLEKGSLCQVPILSARIKFRRGSVGSVCSGLLYEAAQQMLSQFILFFFFKPNRVFPAWSRGVSPQRWWHYSPLSWCAQIHPLLQRTAIWRQWAEHRLTTPFSALHQQANQELHVPFTNRRRL